MMIIILENNQTYLYNKYRDSRKTINLYISKTPRNPEYLYMYKLSFAM